MNSFFAFLNAIPKLLALIDLAEKAFGPNWDGKLIKIMDSHVKLQSAKTEAERDEALKNIANGWGAN